MHCGPVCESNTSTDHRLPISSDQNTNTDGTARVTVIGDTHVSDNVMDFLSLGPSFSIAQNVNGAVFRKVVGGLQRLRDQLRIPAYKHENTPQSTFVSRKLLPSVSFPRTFCKEPEPVREADVKFRIVSAGVLATFNQHRNQRHRNLTRHQWQGFREVRELTSNGTLRISVSDKGGEFVVMPQTLNREITERHLMDNSIYRRVAEKEFTAQYKRLNHVWMSVGKAAGIDERFLSRLKVVTS
ncbi:hypothetical protein RB195_015007 [Necator americanus]|uniref:SHSP domain-containing protein n=1 Tax=Necator americanus TaxID=51031 RepID=A0ABR1E2L7_NECAM